MTSVQEKSALTRISNRDPVQIRPTLILSYGMWISQGFLAYNSCMYIGVTTGFSTKKRTGPYKKPPDYSKALRTGKIWPA